MNAHALPAVIALGAAAGVGGARRARVGCVQGRRAVVRRRFRDRAPDAHRRRPHLPLDDLGQFLSAVALGQVTPGPVVATVAAVGYAAYGVGGAVLAAIVAFLPSFTFVLIGGGHFERLRGNARAGAFLDGAGPAAIGAILGSAIPLASCAQ